MLVYIFTADYYFVYNKIIDQWNYTSKNIQIVLDPFCLW